MKNILIAIKEQLPAAATNIRDIEIIPHEEMLPESARFPFVGIKDKDIKSDGNLDPITGYQVQLFCYVEILKLEASIIGDAATKKIGVLELAEEVLNGVLSLGNLGLSDIVNYEADLVSPASEPGWHMNSYIQRKQVSVWYFKNS